jgi:hypothetical protein
VVQCCVDRCRLIQFSCDDSAQRQDSTSPPEAESFTVFFFRKFWICVIYLSAVSNSPSFQVFSVCPRKSDSARGPQIVDLPVAILAATQAATQAAILEVIQEGILAVVKVECIVCVLAVLAVPSKVVLMLTLLK